MRTVPSRGISPKGHHRAKRNGFLEEGERANSSILRDLSTAY